MIRRAAFLHWPIRIGCALKQKDWGVSGLDQKVLNSSQGTPKRTDRECRKRHALGSSSIQLFTLSFFFMGTLQANELTITTQPHSAEAQRQAQIEERRKEYRQVGDAYEGMMVKHFYSQIKSNGQWVDANSPFAPSNGEKIFQEMYDQMVMEDVAKRRPLGVSDLVVQQLEGKGGVRTRPRVNYNK